MSNKLTPVDVRACAEHLSLCGRSVLTANLGPNADEYAGELAGASESGVGAVWFRRYDGKAQWILRGAPAARVGALAAVFGGGGTDEEAVFVLGWPQHCAILGWWGVDAAEREQAGWADIPARRPPPPVLPDRYAAVSDLILVGERDGFMVEGPGPGHRFVDAKAVRASGVETAYAAAEKEDPRVLHQAAAIHSAWEAVRSLDDRGVLLGDEDLADAIRKVIVSHLRREPPLLGERKN